MGAFVAASRNPTSHRGARLAALVCVAAAAAAAAATAAAAVADPAAAPVAAVTGRETPELLRDVHLDVRTSPDSLTVGDPLLLELRVDAPHGMDVTFPETLPAGGPADLLQRTVIQPRESDPQGQKSGTGLAPPAPGFDRWTARYTVAVFGSGEVALPPWKVTVKRDSLFAIASTDSIRLTLSSVLDDSLAAAKIRDLKPQASLPLPQWPYWVGAGALLLLALALAWWLRRRRRPKAAIVPIIRQRPADEVALEALRRLDTRRLPVDGKFKEYYVALSEILRRYLEDGFGVAALEETTEELLYDLGRHGFDRDLLNRIRSMCEASDLVKFAKYEPSIEDAVRELDRVRDFVTSTASRMTPHVAPLVAAPGAGTQADADAAGAGAAANAGGAA